ncbi:MAG: hypothetical protein H7343_09355, partial [Undibacterium sp.]|nr:hypothetical protein [Opitutaceae bacterium]
QKKSAPTRPLAAHPSTPAKADPETPPEAPPESVVTNDEAAQKPPPSTSAPTSSPPPVILTENSAVELSSRPAPLDDLTSLTSLRPPAHSEISPSPAADSALAPALNLALPPLRRIRFRLTPWQPRLLRDAILPTQPARRSETESIDALRTRLFRERQHQLPAAFQSPATQLGFALELPADNSLSTAQWFDARGARPPTATVNGTHAEFAWSDAQPPSAFAPFTLLSSTGRTLARVDFDAHRQATLTTTAEIRTWPWLAVTSSPTATSCLNLDWQVLSGSAAPPSWKPHAHRLDLVPLAADTGLHQRILAVLDRTTG